MPVTVRVIILDSELATRVILPAVCPDLGSPMRWTLPFLVMQQTQVMRSFGHGKEKIHWLASYRPCVGGEHRAAAVNLVQYRTRIAGNCCICMGSMPA